MKTLFHWIGSQKRRAKCFTCLDIASSGFLVDRINDLHCENWDISEPKIPCNLLSNLGEIDWKVRNWNVALFKKPSKQKIHVFDNCRWPHATWSVSFSFLQKMLCLKPCSNTSHLINFYLSSILYPVIS